MKKDVSDAVPPCRHGTRGGDQFCIFCLRAAFDAAESDRDRWMTDAATHMQDARRAVERAEAAEHERDAARGEVERLTKELAEAKALLALHMNKECEDVLGENEALISTQRKLTAQRDALRTQRDRLREALRWYEGIVPEGMVLARQMVDHATAALAAAVDTSVAGDA